MVTIKIVIGSTRPGRFGVQPAAWLNQIAQQYSDKANTELIDLAEQNLPLLDETVPASRGNYQNEHTQKWAEVIGKSDGFVFVSPEYNHSYAPSLKNAIDYLAKEWHHKPVTFVSYGAEAGGTRGVEHLRASLAWLKMYDLSEQVILRNYWENVNDKGEYQFSERQEQTARAMLESLIFWAEKMKAARAELNAG